MKEKWTTKAGDMYVAQQIMEEYAREYNTEALGLFELVVNKDEKQMNFRLSSWVVTLATHFKSIYGDEQGDFVTRKIISGCLTNGQTIH